MIHLELNDKEKQALGIALKSYLSNMSYEISDTDRKAFRDELKERRDLLQTILDAVGGAE